MKIVPSGNRHKRGVWFVDAESLARLVGCGVYLTVRTQLYSDWMDLCRIVGTIAHPNVHTIIEPKVSRQKRRPTLHKKSYRNTHISACGPVCLRVCGRSICEFIAARSRTQTQSSWESALNAQIVRHFIVVDHLTKYSARDLSVGFFLLSFRWSPPKQQSNLRLRLASTLYNFETKCM